MKKIFLAILFLSSLCSYSVLAQQIPQTITLKDGTVIKGELSHVANGFYTIKSSTMGTVTVAADQVLTISNSATATGAIQTTADGKITDQAMNMVKTNIMEDPAIMSLVQELIQDPAIADLIKNPSLLQDVLSMDPQRIENNIDAQKLLENPTMQKIIALTADKFQNPAP